jgi:cell wall-associated NlpC family hydrolase
VDCSGFSRWVYALAYGYDILGPGSVSNTTYQMGKLREVASGAEAPGDLVFFEPTGDPATPGYSEHVGVYIGDNEMINAPYTGVNVRADQVTGSSTTQGLSVMGYYRVA